MPEEDAFCVFVNLMKDYRLRELYKPSMADLSLCFHLLEKSMEELFPNLHLHFRAVVSKGEIGRNLDILIHKT